MAMAKSITTPSRQEGVTRRNLIKAAPLSAAMLALPEQATASTAEDPVLTYYRQWIDARTNWVRLLDLPGNENFDLPESKVEEAKEYAAFDAMCEATPTSLAGIAALAHVLWDLVGPATHHDNLAFFETAGSQNCKIIHAIWRAAGGNVCLPNADTVLNQSIG